MMIVEPHLSQVVPLFRGLHTYHAQLAPSVYHCDASDADFLEILKSLAADGARVFAHDAGWGLVSYIIARQEQVARTALRFGRNSMVIEHLYVAPPVRGRRLGQALVAHAEHWARDLGCDSWLVNYHCDNPGAQEFYSALGAVPWKGMSEKPLR